MMIAASPSPGRKRRGLTISQFLPMYVSSRDMKQSSIDQLGYAVQSLNRYAGRDVLLTELTPALINGWINFRLDVLSNKTVHGQRNNVLALWRAAYKQKLVKQGPHDIRQVRVLPTIPTAWTLSELKLLLAAATTLEGEFEETKVLRRTMMTALLMTGFYSGLRPCDLLAMTTANLGADGRLVVLQQKTGHLYDTTLPIDCMRAISETRPETRSMVFGITKRQFHHWTGVCCRAAGLDGSPKWLRKTGATAVEIAQPGSAMAYLGHKTPGLAYKHYVDLRQVTNKRPLPPTIGLEPLDVDVPLVADAKFETEGDGFKLEADTYHLAD